MIHFDEARLQEAKRAHDLWWQGKLDRPLINITMVDAHPAREAPPVISQANCTDFSYTPAQVIDGLDARLSRCEFLGDAFPAVSFDCFGPGVLAAFCGAEIRNGTGLVWFYPKEELPLEEIHVKYDKDNEIVRRIKAIYRAGIERWGNSVVMSMPDLGGVLDIAATFRGTENLLMDLCEEPEEVERLIGEIETAWHEAYRDLSGVLQGANMGYTDWSSLFSSSPSYVLQCDFCYMIGPQMFDRFVLPTLARDCEKLGHTLYHLDGVGELPHLDSLLTLEGLTAVQWQYGAGEKPVSAWNDVYERIITAGKGLQIIDNEHEFTASVEFLRRYGGRAHMAAFLTEDERGAAERLMKIRGIGQ